MGWLSSLFRRSAQAEQSNADPVVYYNRGNAFLGQSDFEQAIREFTAAISCDPCAFLPYRDQLPIGLKDKPFDPCDEIYTSPKSFFNRASALQGQGNVQDAIDDYTRAIDLCPQFHGAYNNRSAAFIQIAIQHRRDGNLAEAEQALVKARADLEQIHAITASLDVFEASNLIFIKTELGSLRIESGQTEKAVEDLGGAVVVLRALCDTVSQETTSHRQAARNLCGNIGLRISGVMNSCDPETCRS